jgi:hypothetical protein
VRVLDAFALLGHCCCIRIGDLDGLMHCIQWPNAASECSMQHHGPKACNVDGASEPGIIKYRIEQEEPTPNGTNSLTASVQHCAGQSYTACATKTANHNICAEALNRRLQWSAGIRDLLMHAV